MLQTVQGGKGSVGRDNVGLCKGERDRLGET